MCGIVKIYNLMRTPRVDSGIVGRMNESQFRRGPDEVVIANTLAGLLNDKKKMSITLNHAGASVENMLSWPCNVAIYKNVYADAKVRVRPL